MSLSDDNTSEVGYLGIRNDVAGAPRGTGSTNGSRASEGPFRLVTREPPAEGGNEGTRLAAYPCYLGPTIPPTLTQRFRIVNAVPAAPTRITARSASSALPSTLSLSYRPRESLWIERADTVVPQETQNVLALTHGVHEPQVHQSSTVASLE
jgi:hypothetical protein